MSHFLARSLPFTKNKNITKFRADFRNTLFALEISGDEIIRSLLISTNKITMPLRKSAKTAKQYQFPISKTRRHRHLQNTLKIKRSPRTRPSVRPAYQPSRKPPRQHRTTLSTPRSSFVVVRCYRTPQKRRPPQTSLQPGRPRLTESDWDVRARVRGRDSLFRRASFVFPVLECFLSP